MPAHPAGSLSASPSSEFRPARSLPLRTSWFVPRFCRVCRRAASWCCAQEGKAAPRSLEGFQVDRLTGTGGEDGDWWLVGPWV